MKGTWIVFFLVSFVTQQSDINSDIWISLKIGYTAIIKAILVEYGSYIHVP